MAAIRLPVASPSNPTIIYIYFTLFDETKMIYFLTYFKQALRLVVIKATLSGF